MARVVDWVSGAYQDIQNKRTSWRFLKNDFSFQTIAGTQNYTPAAVSLPEHASWVKEDIRIYKSAEDETFLQYLPWAVFREAYLFGVHRTAQGRPTVVSVTPHNALAFSQLPDDAYTVTGEYYKRAQTMTANADTPLFPDRFHMIIVWRALMFYGAYAAADEKYAHGQNEFKTMLPALELDQLEDFTYGAPLA